MNDQSKTLAHFDLGILLDQLTQLRPETTEHLSLLELEWVLSDFVRSWGQRLLLDTATWPPLEHRQKRRDFGITYLPCSVATDFPLVSVDQIRRLALAEASCALYVLLLDYIIDNPSTASVSIKLAVNHLLLHAHELLNELFPPDSLFWPEFKRCMSLMSRAMLEECQRHLGTASPFSLAEFKQIAHGKMALAQINWIGLTVLNSTPEHIPTLTACWNAIGLVEIIQDDVLDWREDYASANYTYLLSQVLLTPPFQAQVEAGHLPGMTEMGAVLFCTDSIEALYLLAGEDLKIAQEQALNINCPTVADLIGSFHSQICSWPTELFKRKLATLLAMHQTKP